MKLFLVRHGQTIENIKEIVQGQKHGQLTKIGIKQAKLLAKHLKDYKFDAIYCSDLKRTTDTLKAIKKYHPLTPVFYSQELRETCMGKLEGKTAEEYFAAISKLPGTFMTKKAKGAESQKEVRERAAKFIKFLKKNHARDNVLVVSHGGVIKMFLAVLMKLPTKQLKGGKVTIQNTSICEATVNSRGTTVHCINKIDHLGRKDYKISLRKIKAGDKKYFAKWWRDRELLKLTSGILKPISEQELAGYFDAMLKSKTDYHFMIILNQKAIGHIALVKRKNKWYETQIIIGDKKYRNQGLGTRAIKLLVKKAKSFGIGKIYLEVRPDNRMARRAYGKAGFVRVAIKKYPGNKSLPEVVRMELKS